MSKQRQPSSFDLNNWARLAISLCVLGLPLGLGYVWGEQRGERARNEALGGMQAELDRQREALDAASRRAERKLAVYATRLAELQARLVRLDALGERITDIAGLDQGEFDFSARPALGGPDESLDGNGAAPVPHGFDGELDHSFEELNQRLNDRELQLHLLRGMMVDRAFKRERTVSGWPVKKGWLSSPYGPRNDPFAGHRVWHKGVDFAGREGSEVIAVASGLVVRAEAHKAYGNLLEIDHGDGFVTRYAHNRSNLVKVGELVSSGQVIAELGSTGRATGPHVHFEVYKHGRHVDPASYIRRTIR